MNPQPKLFMLLLGCKPPGRHTEQHDVFFAIGQTPKDLVALINQFWPEANGRIHVDAWREVTQVNGNRVEVVEKTDHHMAAADSNNLFFINLGGYQTGLFDEQHYVMLSVGTGSGDAVRAAKETLFYQHNLSSHIDDKYGIDVDDMYEVEDILLPAQKEKYVIKLTPATNLTNDELHLGYFKLDKLP